MIIIDKALEEKEREGKPIRVALVGAGFMGRGIAFQIIKNVPGLKLVVIANRHPEKAETIYKEAGVDKIRFIENATQLEEAVCKGFSAYTDNAMLLCEAENVDAVLEASGDVEFGAKISLSAIENRKHIILMNAELDATIGPILKVYADKRGVVITNVDGDQPGVIMNLYRFVKGIGLQPVLAGNIKGLHDPYRNPSTQKTFAEKWGQNPQMVTSFADGTKISFEQAVVANATGMKVGKRGMYGPTVPVGTSIEHAADWFPMKEIGEQGIVDYVTGASPSPGVFVLATCDQQFQKHYLNYYKLGTGPWYCFYTPYHLCHFEVSNTIARAVLFKDAAITPLGAPSVGVVAVAKLDLKAGEILDGIGGYKAYGICDNIDTINRDFLLPMGLIEGCRLKNDIPKDQVLTFNDVQIPPDRMCDKLYAKQTAHFME